MTMAPPSLSVCLCVDNVDDCVVPLNEIASGQVFGPQQRLKLSLHGQDRESLDDLALCVLESCYHLVDEVCVSPITVGCYDVTVVLMPQTNRQCDAKPLNSLPHYIIAVSNFLEDKVRDSSKILVFGPKANVAATILSRELQGMGGNQLLAFPTDQINTRTEGRSIGHQYKIAFTLYHTVSKWWAGTKDTPKKTEAGIKFFTGKKSTPIQERSVFLTVPVDIVGEQTFKIDPSCQIDADKLHDVVCETERVLREMENVVNKGNEKYDDKNVYCYNAQL